MPAMGLLIVSVNWTGTCLKPNKYLRDNDICLSYEYISFIDIRVTYQLLRYLTLKRFLIKNKIKVCK